MSRRLFDYFANAAGATSCILMAAGFSMTPGWSRWVAAPLIAVAALRLALRSEFRGEGRHG